jgi:hypothetical protein
LPCCSPSCRSLQSLRPKPIRSIPITRFPNFTVDHLGISTIYGRFNKNSGKVTIDRAAKTASIELNIETASVDTGDVEKAAGPARATSTCAPPISSTRRNFRA